MLSQAEMDRFYEDAIIIDGLNISNWDSRRVFASLRTGGVTAINATSAVWEGFTAALDNIAAWQRRFREHESTLVQARSVGDILRAKLDGRVAIILGWQNASPLENDLDRLALFHALGLRIIQVTYNERNLLGNGCYERRDGGLSHFGVDAVREMNRLGVLIDLSHVGERTMLEVIELSERPVACTHANARATFDHVRNKSDEALRLLAERGGVVGANAFPIFLPGGYEATLDDYLDAIEDLVQRTGIDHVAIGCDFTQDQPPSFFDWLFSQQGTKPSATSIPYPVVYPRGLRSPEHLPNLARGLLERGYDAEDVAKILGGNWLRLFTEVWT